MTNTTATVGLSTQLRTYYDRNLLERLLPNLVYIPFGQIKPMPTKEGQTINFRRFSSLAAATTPLTEGVTPSGSALAMTQLTASPSQYGDFVEISDVLNLTAPDPVLTEAGELLGEQAALTLDTIVRDQVCAGTSVQYAGSNVARNTIAAADKLTVTEIRKAVRTLQNNKVSKLTSILDASDGVGTKPIAAAYIGIVGPYGVYDLKGDSKFVKVEEYGSRTPLLPNEVGSLDEVRFVQSTNPKIFTGAGAGGTVDVHICLVLGANAFGVVAPAGVENIIKGFGAGDDPLNQRATSGWKAYFTAVILQQLAMIRIEHGVTA
jgi:N4-gp56 family major capsid protein